MVEPVVVNKNNTVIGGHQRLIACKQLSIDTVPVVYVDLSKKKEKILNLALNRIHGDWDMDKLAVVLEELKMDDGDDLSLTGFSEIEIGEILDSQIEDDGSEDEFDAESEASKIKNPISKRGEVYQLGRHHLMCGDATVREDVEKLMDGKKANMVFTDPPYGMNMGFENDEKNGIELKNWNDKWIQNLPKVTAFLSFHSPRLFWTLLDSAREKGWKFERYFTFYKSNDRAFPWHGWLAVSEAILLFTKGKHKYNPKPPPKSEYSFWHDTYEWTHKNLVFDESKEDRQGFHVTIKPLPVVMNLLWRLTLENQMVVDLFGGSGTTLIACEKTGRVCRMLEIDPVYCDVIRNRYEKYVSENSRN